MNYRFFYLSLALFLVQCGTSEIQKESLEKPKSKEEWILFRSQSLNIPLAEAQIREEQLSETAPPEGIWDKSLKQESANIWYSSCAQCHGETGRLENVPQQNPMPRKLGTFGMSMGFFFGGDKMRAGIYSAVKDGKKKDGTLLQNMPAWGETFSKEQLWGIVHFIEGL